MQEIAISEFKAKCLALLKRVCKTKKPIRITRLGRLRCFLPRTPKNTDWVRSMAESIEFLGLHRQSTKVILRHSVETAAGHSAGADAPI
jgi:hypothetical protein